MSLYHFVPLFKNKDWMGAIGWMPIRGKEQRCLPIDTSFPENPISPYQINSPDEEKCGRLFNDFHPEQIAGR
jgi:hypothetical protein